MHIYVYTYTLGVSLWCNSKMFDCGIIVSKFKFSHAIMFTFGQIPLGKV